MHQSCFPHLDINRPMAFQTHAEYVSDWWRVFSKEYRTMSDQRLRESTDRISQLAGEVLMDLDAETGGSDRDVADTDWWKDMQ